LKLAGRGYGDGVAETIAHSLPRPALQDDLAATLAAHGLVAERAGDGELEVRFADERERLLADVTLAVEDWLAARELPLVVERGNGGCVLRPPGD
jgi:hypothetical protein